MFYKIKNYYDMFINIRENSIYLTVPAQDVYNQPLLFYELDGTQFYFYFDKYRFIKKSKDKVSKVHVQSKNEELLDLESITKLTYEKKKKVQNRVELLRETFNKSEDFYEFSYDFCNKGLGRLRKLTKMGEWLDDKNEFTKAKSISTWVSQNIKHKGELDIPFKNGIELLEIAFNNGGFLNCRGIAVLTNELNLAASLYSKFVLCMQKERYIDNYHVLNAVYIHDFGKWIMIDSVYNVYFIDKTDKVLSIMEIRNMLRDGKPLFPNQEANYYGKRLSLKLYLRSLVKNFYRFGVPLESKFNGDQPQNIINLVPVKEDYQGLYSVDNPNQFWRTIAV